MKRAVEVASFLGLYRLGSRQNSSLIFWPIALVFTPLNSTKTQFSYSIRYNWLPGRTQKLHVIEETGKSHIWPYLRATKWRLESHRMWRHVLIPRSLHISAYVKLAYWGEPKWAPFYYIAHLIVYACLPKHITSLKFKVSRLTIS